MNRKSGNKFHVNESDLLCKARCGFYGNPAWKGYCSVCYKSQYVRQQQVVLPQKQSSEPHQHSQTLPARRSADVEHEQNFSAFAEKRRQQSDRKSGTVKSFFMKSTKKGKAEDHPSQSTQGIMILYWFSIHKICGEVIQCCVIICK